MTDLSFISIILPCRNEENYIGQTLDSIASSNYDKDKIEILIVDGMSDDKTREIVNRYSQKYRYVKLLDNPKKIVPTALNIGIQNAKGDVIVRMDAHSVYEKDYLAKCIKYLNEYNVDNVGGLVVTLPANNSTFAESIAIGLSHPFGVGNSYFRIGSKKPKFVDSVPYGCFKKEVFDKIGLFNEDLVRNQDDEFNFRIIKNGGKVLLLPYIVTQYYARDSLIKLWRMYFQYGYFKPLVARNVGAVLTWRQLIPSIFVLSIIFSGALSLVIAPIKWIFLLIILLYITVNLAFSFSIAFKKGVRLLFALPVVFAAIHFSYGLGYLKGIWNFIFLKRYKKNDHKDVPLTR